MAFTASTTASGTQLGYARVSAEHQSLDQQTDALAAAGVESNRVYSNKFSGTSTRQQRPGLAELELDLGRERRTTARDAGRAHGQAIGRPKALDQSKVALAQRMHASGESATTIAATLGVSRATIYRILADADSAD
jgi:DNA invertase Pin-like site-specific DNA recombinase